MTRPVDIFCSRSSPLRGSILSALGSSSACPRSNRPRVQWPLSCCPLRPRRPADAEPGQGLDLVTDLVRNDVRLHEIARHTMTNRGLVEESEIKIDLAIAGAIEGPVADSENPQAD